MGNLGAYVAKSFQESEDYQPVVSVELFELKTYSFWENLGLPIPYWRSRVTFENGKVIDIPLGVFSRGALACMMVDWWFRKDRRDRHRADREAARHAKWEWKRSSEDE